MLLPMLTLGVPLLIVALLAVMIGRARHRRRTGIAFASISIEEATSFLYGTKRTELDHRDSWSMMREEDTQAAPPDSGLDLDSGTMTVRRDEQR